MYSSDELLILFGMDDKELKKYRFYEYHLQKLLQAVEKQYYHGLIVRYKKWY